MIKNKVMTVVNHSGVVGPIEFSLTGPQDLVFSVIKFIRNLVRMSGVYY